MPEHHIGRAGHGAAAAVAGSADDQVVDAVAIDVARRRHRAAGVVACVLALDLEAAGAGGDVVEIDGRGEPARVPNTT